MSDFLSALRDPEFRSQYLQGLKDAGNRAAASFFGGPVDLATMALRPLGYSTPDREVVGGSEWMGKQMEQRGMVSEARNPTAEFLASVALPAAMATQAPRIFAAEQKAISNAMAPNALNRQSGALFVPLQDEIDAARSTLQRRIIDLPSGRAEITPRRSSLGSIGPQGLDAEINFFPSDANGMMFSVSPGQNMLSSFPRPGVLTVDERSIINQARQGVSEQKNNLLNLVEAQRLIKNDVPLPPNIPQWASKITDLKKSQQAGPDWWTKALKDNTAKNFDEFADAAKNTNLMMFPKAETSKNPQDIASHFGLKSSQNNDSIVFSSGNGTLKIYGANSDSPYIKTLEAESKGKKEGGGKALYQAAYNWAANNNKTIKPDPSGITDINQIRKIGNALSAQIRNGKLIAEMNSGNFNGLKSISELWREESKIAKKRIPIISNIKFDGSSFNMNDEDIVSMISKKDPTFSKGVGTLTAKRSAVAEWLESATPFESKQAVVTLLAAGSGPLFAMEDPSQ